MTTKVAALNTPITTKEVRTITECREILKTDPSSLTDDEVIQLLESKVLSNMPNFPVFLLNFPLLFFLGGSAQTHFHYVPYIEL